MQPRQETSTRWTAFPPELKSQIQDVFREHFVQRLAQHELVIEGRIFPEELCLRVGFLQTKTQLQSNFEGSVDIATGGADAVAKIHLLVDFLATTIEAHTLEEASEQLPLTWAEHQFENQTVYLQYNRENSDLTRQANELLGIAPDEEAMVIEDPEAAPKKKSSLVH